MGWRGWGWGGLCEIESVMRERAGEEGGIEIEKRN